MTRTALRLHDCVRATRTGLLRTYRTYLRHRAAGAPLSVRRTLTSLARAVLCATGPARPPLRTLLDDARRVVQRRQRRAVRRPCSLAERPLHPRLRGGCRRAGGRDPARTDQRQPGAARHPAVRLHGSRARRRRRRAASANAWAGRRMYTRARGLPARARLPLPFAGAADSGGAGALHAQ